MKFLKTLSFSLILSTLACGTPEAPEDAEACEHLDPQAASKALTATPTFDDEVAIADDHTRYVVTLIDVAGGKGGTVTFASAEEGDYALFLNRAVPVKITDTSGTEVAIEESASESSSCDLIKGRHVFELGVGTYVFEFGPTTESEVGLLLEHVAHDHE